MPRTRKAAAVAALAISLQGLMRGQSVQQGQNTQDSQSVSLSLTESVASKYVKSTGSPIGTGPVQQFQVDLNIGKYFTITGWQDYDIARKALDEVDVSVTAHKTIFKFKNPRLGGINGSVSVQNWRYPDRLIAKQNDYVIISALTYNGPITIKFTEKHLFTNGWTWGRNNYVFDISKGFKVGKWGKSKLVMGPTFRTAYDNDFFGYNGWNIATPGISLGFSSHNVSIDAFAKKEFRMGVPPSKRGFYYEGVSVTLGNLPSVLRKRKN